MPQAGINDSRDDLTSESEGRPFPTQGKEQSEADATPQELAEVAHVPDSRLRLELACCNAELEAAHKILDQHEGKTGTSLEMLMDRLKRYFPAVGQVKPQQQEVEKILTPYIRQLAGQAHYQTTDGEQKKIHQALRDVCAALSAPQPASPQAQPFHEQLRDYKESHGYEDQKPLYPAGPQADVAREQETHAPECLFHNGDACDCECASQRAGEER